MHEKVSRRDFFKLTGSAASSVVASRLFLPEHKKTFSGASSILIERPEVLRISYRRSLAERKTEQLDLSPISPDEQFLCERINAFRADNGLESLVIDLFYSAWARGRSEDMASRQRFSHYASDGSLPLADLQSNCSVIRPALAENIEMNNFPDPKNKAFSDWLNSPHHLENIMGPYTVFGMGEACDINGIWYFTNVFASDYCVAPSRPTSDSSTS